MKLKKENTENDLAETYNLVNRLIHDNRMTFNYYNDTQKIEPIMICYNKKEQKIEVTFRNNLQEYIDELKSLNKEYEKNHK